MTDKEREKWEKKKEYQRRYYAEHPEKYAKYREATRKFRELHPEASEKYREANRKRLSECRVVDIGLIEIKNF